MGMGATLLDQTIGGAVQSYGLGTAIRSSRIPEGNLEALPEPERIQRQSGTLPNPIASGRALLERFGVIDRPEPTAPAMTKEGWEASPFFRDNIPWDAAMTEDRAAALATQYDVRAVRDHFGVKRPFTSIVGNLAGQALDPINYIPIAGPAVRAANIARFGTVKGTATTAALDAAANTAVFGIATRDARARFGDNVSWQATVSEIATAAMIGGAFGTVAGVLGRRSVQRLEKVKAEQEQRLATLQTTQEARIALNEAVAGLVHDGEVRLSPNATEPMARIAEKLETEAAKRPPVLNADDPTFATLAPDQQEIEADWRIANQAQVVNEIEALTAQGRTPNQIIEDMGERLQSVVRPLDEIEGTAVARAPEQIVRSVQAKLEIPSLDQKAEFDAWRSDYEARMARDVVAEPEARRTRGRKGKSRVKVDATPPRPDPIPEGRADAEIRIARADDYRAIAQQYRVDPETGSFIEEAELQQLEAEGRLTDDDRIELDVATRGYEDGAAYGEAMRAAVACMI